VIGRDHRDPHRTEPIPLSIDRILAVADTPQTFERPTDFDLHEFLTERCFNGIHGEPMAVRLRAYGVTARIFAERKFHPSHRVVGLLSAALGRPREDTAWVRQLAARRGNWRGCGARRRARASGCSRCGSRATCRAAA
jgi:hypothetical protein